MFRQTKNGMLINGGNQAYDTKGKSQYYPLFNISFGGGTWPVGFEKENESVKCIWLQCADWQQMDKALYHVPFFRGQPYFFLIDFGAENPSLRWLTAQVQNGRKPVNVPLCKNTDSAGMAIFQIFDTNNPSNVVNGESIVIFGNFKKFGATEGYFVEFNGDFSAYLNAVKNVPAIGNFFTNCDKLVLRKACPVYVQQNDLDADAVAAPVSYTIG